MLWDWNGYFDWTLNPEYIQVLKKNKNKNFAAPFFSVMFSLLSKMFQQEKTSKGLSKYY